jgi:transposase
VSTNEIMDTSLSGKRRHKVWPEALKREIVAACMKPGASVSVVARQYDVNTNMVFTWRKLYGGTTEAASLLMPVVVTPDPPAVASPAPKADLIEIELPGGYRVRIGNNIKAAALRVLLDALERRWLPFRRVCRYGWRLAGLICDAA